MMLDKMVTAVQELVEEINKVEELMKHNIYMRSIATNGVIANETMDALELGDYVMHLHTEFEVLSARHEEVDNILREFCMKRMEEI